MSDEAATLAVSGADDQGDEVFVSLCLAADTAAAVAALGKKQLCDVTGWLLRRGITDGIAGEVAGLCLVECARRFCEK